jgi:endo-1,4-beta-mannosidase
MHTCLLQIHDYASLHLFYYDLPLIIVHRYAVQHCLNKDRSMPYLYVLSVLE